MQARLNGGHGVPWADVAFQSGEWLFLGTLTPITWLLARRFPLARETWGRTLGVHVAGALALCLGWASLGMLLGELLHRHPAQGHFGRDYLSWILTSLPWSVFMYFAVLGCVYAFTYFVEARERETQRSRLAAQLAEARLGALRMQLNPQFLFNSLNAIGVLVRDQNTRDASRMLELLGGLLRRALHAEKRGEVPLAGELHFIEQYLAIEQVRFSDRLRVRWSIDDTVRDALVPEFILQPLVENAVRHGIAKRSDAGLVELRASADGATLILSVVDDGPGLEAEPEAPGLGLANTRARLATRFGDAGSLELLRAPTGGTIATIRLPLRRAPHA